MPVYLKFVLTLTGDSIIDIDEITRILMLNGPVEELTNEMHITNRELFTKYSGATLDLLKLPLGAAKNDILQK